MIFSKRRFHASSSDSRDALDEQLVEADPDVGSCDGDAHGRRAYTLLRAGRRQAHFAFQNMTTVRAPRFEREATLHSQRISVVMGDQRRRGGRVFARLRDVMVPRKSQRGTERELHVAAALPESRRAELTCWICSYTCNAIVRSAAQLAEGARAEGVEELAVVRAGGSNREPGPHVEGQAAEMLSIFQGMKSVPKAPPISTGGLPPPALDTVARSLAPMGISKRPRTPP